MSLSFFNWSWFDLCLFAGFLFLPLVLLVILSSKKSISKNNRLPPSPPKLPLIGNLHQLSSLTHRSLYSLSQKHGPDLMLIYLGSVPALVVTSADIVREIMRTHDKTFSSRPSLKGSRLVLYGGLDIAFAPYGDHWRQVRKLFVNHLVGAKMMRSFRKVREEEVVSMIADISNTCSSGGSVDMTSTLNLFITNIVCRAAFGRDYGEGGNNKSTCNIFCDLTKEHIDILGTVFIEDCFPMLGWLDAVTGLEKRARRSAEKWEDVLDQIIRNHENMIHNNGHVPENDNCVDALLSLMDGPNMDVAIDRQLIKILVKDMIAGGTGTTSSTLEWGMAELICNQEAMKKLQEEVRGIGNGGSIITEEDLSRMNYLKCVIKEVLRLHPPGPLSLPRESMETCEIQGYEVPKHTRVLINTWAIGRDPRFFEVPLKFRPERFLDGSVDFKGHDFQLIPFGGGRRICPGMQFAVTSLELAFANLVYRFDWKLPQGMEIDDVDMTETPGIIGCKKQKLILIAKPTFVV